MSRRSAFPGGTAAGEQGSSEQPAKAGQPHTLRASDLVPRLEQQGYTQEDLAARRRWLEERTGVRLDHVAACSIAADLPDPMAASGAGDAGSAGGDGSPGERPSEQPATPLRGNIENPIGAAQVPLGVAGPLLVAGEHARGLFYVPLATTEGALVRSYERGMVTLTRAGGAIVRLWTDENRVSPVFLLDDVAAAREFCRELEQSFPAVRAAAEATTTHGKLLRLEPRPMGREVMVNFCYSTGDAHGMNMIARATEEACRWIVANTAASGYYLFSGLDSEKRASGSLFAGGKGKKVVAGARLPAKLVRAYLHTTAAGLHDLWQHTVLGHLQAGALGYNGHYANGLAALFIACGQDVANVANSAVGVTCFEVVEDGDLYASVTLPSLTVATVGGGTGLGTARECLRLLGCEGEGGAPKLAEIAAATLLAGELSMGAALASGEFVAAHETYGRNRPKAGGGEPES